MCSLEQKNALDEPIESETTERSRSDLARETCRIVRREARTELEKRPEQKDDTDLSEFDAEIEADERRHEA